MNKYCGIIIKADTDWALIGGSSYPCTGFHFEVWCINSMLQSIFLVLTRGLSPTSVGAGTALPPNRGLMVSFPESLQVYRGFPDRGSRLRGAVARVARWIWRGLHVVSLMCYGAIATISQRVPIKMWAKRLRLPMYFREEVRNVERRVLLKVGVWVWLSTSSARESFSHTPRRERLSIADA